MIWSKHLHLQRITVIYGAYKRRQHFEECNTLGPSLFVAGRIVRCDSFEQPRNQARMNADHELAIEALDHGKLCTSDDESGREELAEGDGMLFRGTDAV